MSPGGKGANSSVATHRLSRAKPKQSHDAESETSMEGNIQVRMVGAVGADQFGPALKDNLIACGVNADGVRIVEGQQTAVSSILVERAKNGANRIMQFPGAAYSLEPTDFMTLESLGGGVAPDLVISQLELRRETVEQAIETAHKHNVEVLLNPSPAFYIMPDIFPMVTHLVMNEVEAGDLSSCKPDDIDKLTGWTSVAKYFHELGVKNVVVTLGEKGAYYSNEVESGKVEAEKYCRVVDTAGAGDSFTGAYAASYMQQKLMGEWDIKVAVQYGCKAAARIIEHVGCLSQIGWADEIDIIRYPEEAEETTDAL